jgi:hypothetical protein
MHLCLHASMRTHACVLARLSQECGVHRGTHACVLTSITLSQTMNTCGCMCGCNVLHAAKHRSTTRFFCLQPGARTHTQRALVLVLWGRHTYLTFPSLASLFREKRNVEYCIELCVHTLFTYSIHVCLQVACMHFNSFLHTLCCMSVTTHMHLHTHTHTHIHTHTHTQ